MGLAARGRGHILVSRFRAGSLGSFALKQIDNEKAATGDVRVRAGCEAVAASPPAGPTLPAAASSCVLAKALCMATAARK